MTFCSSSLVLFRLLSMHRDGCMQMAPPPFSSSITKRRIGPQNFEPFSTEPSLHFFLIVMSGDGRRQPVEHMVLGRQKVDVAKKPRIDFASDTGAGPKPSRHRGSSSRKIDLHPYRQSRCHTSDQRVRQLVRQTTLSINVSDYQSTTTERTDE